MDGERAVTGEPRQDPHLAASERIGGGERRAADRSRIRPDIQALRAIAVLSVFVFHLWPGALPGGFSGVDVFFVISGFLIAGKLIHEAETSGSVRVLEFWARRVRRLLPGALTALAATSVAVYVWVPLNLWPQFLREVAGATVYIQNWVLANDAVDYFAAGNAPSPVQHYWTLSVEEQFYVFTPLLLLGLLVLARRPVTKRAILFTGVATVTVASFACSVWLTTISQPSAYFVTTTRAWEFGVGALLVFAPAPRSAGMARLAMVAGLLGILGAARFLSSAMPFPGAIAAWPVLATAAAIWGGVTMGRRWIRVAAFGPVQLVGDISYALYLWHWPLIVIAPFALDHALSIRDKVAIVGMTFVLAYLSTRLIEDPVRYSRALTVAARSRIRTAAWGAAGMVAVLVISVSGLAVAQDRRASTTQQAAQITTQHPTCLGAMAIENAAACQGVIPAAALVPDPADAGTDSFNRPDCWATVDSAELHVCSLGPSDATVRLMAIGDSHSNGLLIAYQAIADRNHWQIDVAGHNGCYWTMAVQRKPVQAMVEGCEGWKARLMAWIDARPAYDAILVTNARRGFEVTPAPGQSLVAATVDGLVRAWATQTVRGSRIIAIRDNPAMRSDIVTCVVRHPTDANTRCASPEATAVGPTDPLVQAVGMTANARLIDLTELYCPGDVCLPLIGNVVVYLNKDHVTATWVSSLAPILSDRIAAALPGAHDQ